MAVLETMRDRLAAALQIELRNRGLSSSADIVFAVADRTLGETQFEALAAYVGAVERGESPSDPGGPRDQLIGDPAFGDVIVLNPEEP